MIRREALALARQWIGTPFHPQASRHGVGCDCAGLVRGVWRELYGTEPEGLPVSPWPEHPANNHLTATLDYWMTETSKPVPGDVMTFRWRHNDPAGHCGILAPHQRLIHTYWRRAVSETAITAWWSRRECRAYSFPDR
ncbi:peptidase P60 [Hyphobacterium sp.]|uniref:peptidase P60 n=1 Tax=Hyphobacterium sp. TaxID=2004662 RepID=UPI003BA84D71